jgi:uncharacterized membrane protein YfcA
VDGHKNIDWRLFLKLAPAGVAGGVFGEHPASQADYSRENGQ